MAAKDKYGNNLRRGNHVKDLRQDSNLEGEVVGTDGQYALVHWTESEEERVHGSDLVMTDRTSVQRRR